MGIARGFATRAGLTIALTSALGLGGCSDTPDLGGSGAGTAGSSDGGTSGEIELVVAEVVATHCEYVDACGCAGEVGTDCEETLGLTWDARLEAGESRGLTLDAVCLDSTLARMQAQECRWPASSLGPVCETFCAVYHGELQLGDACTAYDIQVSDCAQGLACSEGRCAEPCAALGGALTGESCRNPEFGDQFEECVQGLQCDWESQVCVTLADVGQSCNTQNCMPGLWCDWNSDVCRAGAAEGASCDQAECAEQLYCDWSNDFPVCRNYAGSGASCQNAQCDTGLVCSNAQVCTEPPGPGQVCASGQCASGALCDWEVERCVALPTAGESCLFGECAGSAWCEFADPMNPEGQCAELTPYGQACSGHNQCQSAYCPAGYCDHRPEGGEACSPMLPCANGLACNGSTCVTTRSLGSAACVYNGW